MENISAMMCERARLVGRFAGDGGFCAGIGKAG
jgi:hypothetical protein